VPELRKDPITRRWVIIATERAARPTDFPPGDSSPNHSASCPFCEGHEAKTPREITAIRRPGTPPDTPGWEVRVVPNKFPALPIVPKRAIEEIEGAQGHFAREGRCVYCDILRQETAARVRVVWENDEFISFVPFAAWCPFECWLIPKRHEASFGNLGDPQIPA